MMKKGDAADPRPYFVALIVMMVLLTAGALMFTLMPETMESILSEKENVTKVMSVKELQEKGGLDSE